MFFLHLSQAKMIEGMYGAGGSHVTLSGATVTGGSYGGANPPSVTADSTYVNEILPRAKFGDNMFYSVGNGNNKNYIVLSGINKMYSLADADSVNGISPVAAYSIDLKMDDGLPATGGVYALDVKTNILGYGDELAIPSANDCVNGSVYYTNNRAYSDVPNCSLRFDFR